jgi:hypothetical protein
MAQILPGRVGGGDGASGRPLGAQPGRELAVGHRPGDEVALAVLAAPGPERLERRGVLPEGGAQAGGDLLRAPRAGMGQQDGELVTAHPGEQVAVVQGALQQGTDQAQR